MIFISEKKYVSPEIIWAKVSLLTLNQIKSKVSKEVLFL